MAIEIAKGQPRSLAEVSVVSIHPGDWSVFCQGRFFQKKARRNFDPGGRGKKLQGNLKVLIT
jgi:hypothetical protein